MGRPVVPEILIGDRAPVGTRPTGLVPRGPVGAEPGRPHGRLAAAAWCRRVRRREPASGRPPGVRVTPFGGEWQVYKDETSCNDARYFGTAATDPQLNDASAERHPRTEGGKGRVWTVAVKRVASNRQFAPACLARGPPTAELRNAVHGRARRRRGSRDGRGGSRRHGLPPRGTRRVQRRTGARLLVGGDRGRHGTGLELAGGERAGWVHYGFADTVCTRRLVVRDAE